MVAQTVVRIRVLLGGNLWLGLQPIFGQGQRPLVTQFVASGRRQATFD